MENVNFFGVGVDGAGGIWEAGKRGGVKCAQEICF